MRRVARTAVRHDEKGKGARAVRPVVIDVDSGSLDVGAEGGAFEGERGTGRLKIARGDERERREEPTFQFGEKRQQQTSISATPRHSVADRRL